MFKTHSSSQVTLADMFLLTAIAAVAVIIFRNAGLFWSLMGAIAVFCLRMPNIENCNPILQAVSYTIVTLGTVCGLTYCLNIPPLHAIFPCCILPAFAYLVGFYKALNG